MADLVNYGALQGVDPNLLRVLARIKTAARARTEAEAKRIADEKARAALESQLSQARNVVEHAPARWRSLHGFDQFARAQLKVVDEQKNVVPFVLRHMQRAILAKELWQRRRTGRCWQLILKYRKGGVSTLEQGLSYQTLWANPRQECLTLAHRSDDTRMLFRMTGTFLELQPPEFKHQASGARINHIEFPGWGSIYMAQTAGKGGVGRGSTYSRIHLAEAAHYHDLKELHDGLAKSQATNASYVLESTANGREGPGKAFYDFWQTARRGQSDFEPLFFPWQSEPTNALPVSSEELESYTWEEVGKDAGGSRQVTHLHSITEEERLITVRYGLSPEQLKFWRSERRRIVGDGQSGQKIYQEMALDEDTCFLYGTNSYFDLDRLAELELLCRMGQAQVEENGILKIWETPQSRQKEGKLPASYVFGVDPAGGDRMDDSAVVGFNTQSHEQCMSWCDNTLEPDLFGEKLAELGYRWANVATGSPAYMVIERNNHGHAVIGALRKTGYPIDRIYHGVDQIQIDPVSGLPKRSPKAGYYASTSTDYSVGVSQAIRPGTDFWIKDQEVLRSIRRVSKGPRGPEFTGRDLAVALALTTIGWDEALEQSAFGFVGGQIVRF